MTVTVTGIPTPPPQRNDPSTFAARADATMLAIPNMVTTMNSQNLENNSINMAVNANKETVEDLTATIVANIALLEDVRDELPAILLVAADIIEVAAVGGDIASVVAVAAALGNIAAAVANLPALAAKVSKTGDVMSGLLDVRTSGADSMAAATPNHQMEVRNDSTGAAAIRFNRNGLHAFFLGIDSANALSIGGGSMGTVKRRLYHEGNIVAAVADTGGVPSGGVVESGSNANGRYVKFADGTQICVRPTTIALTTGTATGAVFQTASQSGNWAAAFVAIPEMFTTARESATANCWAGNGTPTTGGFSAAVGFSGANTATCKLDIMAVGRWK